MILACLDVHYGPAQARAACVVLGRPEASVALEERVAHVTGALPYVPGELYRRELPGLLAVLAQVQTPLDAAVVDGYVWLDGRGRPGLGAHLFRARGEELPIVGVAKNRFGPPLPRFAREVRRGSSRRPLYVTAAGMDPARAALLVEGMHGEGRVPWALRRADRLARGADEPSRGAAHPTALEER